MNIGIISDIHIDKNQTYPITELLAQKSREHALQCLLIAGDISNHFTTTLNFLDRFCALSGIPVYFVPGNHDLWDQWGVCKNTWETYRRYAEHPACLIDRCVPLNDQWVVTGQTGWYDYAFGNKKFSREEFERHNMYGRTWQDSVHVRWNILDPQAHKEMLGKLEKQLIESSGKKRIVLTHMVGIEEFLVPESREMWDYFNAFIGSPEYGALFQKYKVEYSVMGHVHFRARHTQNETQYLCSCLNYYTEWQSDNAEHEIEEALTVMTL